MQPSILARDLRCDGPPHTARHLLTHTALGPRGARFYYNPTLFSWASRPIAAAGGAPFSELVEQYVFIPAGMAHSARSHRALPLPPKILAALAPPYRIDSTGRVVRAPEPGPQGDGAGGGVTSTVLDLARFDQALERGDLISRASYVAMTTPARSPTGEPLPYGLGWFIQEHLGQKLVWHSGWLDDAYSALYLKVPNERLTLILLANGEGIWWDNPPEVAAVHTSPFAQAFLAAFVRPSRGASR